MRFVMMVVAAILLLPSALAQPVVAPDTVMVRMETSEGAIVLALDAKRAPVTTANFLRYVEQKRFEDRKSTRLNSSHIQKSRMPSSA